MKDPESPIITFSSLRHVQLASSPCSQAAIFSLRLVWLVCCKHLNHYFLFIFLRSIFFLLVQLDSWRIAHKSSLIVTGLSDTWSMCWAAARDSRQPYLTVSNVAGHGSTWSQFIDQSMLFRDEDDREWLSAVSYSAVRDNAGILPVHFMLAAPQQWYCAVPFVCSSTMYVDTVVSVLFESKSLIVDGLKHAQWCDPLNIDHCITLFYTILRSAKSRSDGQLKRSCYLTQIQTQPCCSA